MPQFPDVPTVSELLPGFEPLPGWTGLFAPAGMPGAVWRRLTGDVQKALRNPEARDKMNQVGFEVIGNTPEQFAAQIKREIALVEKIARAANIRLE